MPLLKQIAIGSCRIAHMWPLKITSSAISFLHRHAYGDSEQSGTDTIREHRLQRYSTVDTLITQVYKLEERLNRIELSDISRCSFNSTMLSSEVSGANYYNQDAALASTKSTPQKPHTRLKSNSLPSTPNQDRHRLAHRRRALDNATDADESSLSITPDKRNNKEVLGEIDEFLTNVKAIQKLSSNSALLHTHVKMPISLDESPLKLSDLETEEKPNGVCGLNLQDVDRLLKEMEIQHKQMDACDRELRGMGSSTMQTWLMGMESDSVPNLGCGMRDIMYQKPSPNEGSDHSGSTKCTSVCTTDATTHTVLENQKTQPSAPEPAIIKQNATSQSAINSMANYSHSRLGLADLWNSKTSIDNVTAITKLEEERFRRQLCEKHIQKLQMNLMEVQQMLAVSDRTSAMKDAALQQLKVTAQRAWQQFQMLDNQRSLFQTQLTMVQERADREIMEASQKANRHEMEISKAMDIARSNEELLKNMEKENAKLIAKIDALHTELEGSQQILLQAEKERQRLTEQYEKNLLQDKNSLTEAQTELVQIKNALFVAQTELKIAKEDNEKFEKQLKTERAVNVQLEAENKKLLGALEASKNLEKTIQLELKSSQEQTDKIRNEMRTYYQQQVDVLVHDKLKEFQLQLEQAEKSAKEDFKRREEQITRTAATQLQQLSEKHQLEVSLMEKKHKEEVHLFNLKNSHLQRQIIVQHKQIEHNERRRANLICELEKVMEAQWMEALRVIHGKTPAITSRSDAECRASDSQKLAFMQELAKHKDHLQENLEGGDVPYKSTPLSSRLQQQNEESLQKYIKMLTDKIPSNPTEHVSSSLRSDRATEGSSNDLTTWNQEPNPGPKSTELKMPATSSKENKFAKPPWK